MYYIKFITRFCFIWANMGHSTDWLALMSHLQILYANVYISNDQTYNKVFPLPCYLSLEILLLNWVSEMYQVENHSKGVICSWVYLSLNKVIKWESMNEYQIPNDFCII
jgi:hypothetical protein